MNLTNLCLGFVCVLSASMMLSGCGSKSDIELGKVSGIVTMDGAPLPNATVRFSPVEGGRMAVGVTNENGEYTMQYSASSAGALVGKMKVEITTGNEDEPALQPETVPVRYNRNSELTAEVTPKSNKIDFALTSAK